MAKNTKNHAKKRKVNRVAVTEAKQVFLITADPYRQDIVVVCNGQVSDAVKYYKKIGTPSALLNVKEIESKEGYAMVHEIGGDGAQTYTELPKGFLVVISHSSSWLLTVDSVVHECLHLTHYILRNAGVTLSAESEEAYTYLQAHLVRQILTKIF